MNLERQPRLASYLEKCSDFLGHWNKRYFVLEQRRLIAFLTKGDVPQRVVCLSKCTLRDEGRDESRNSVFALYIPSLGRWHRFRTQDHELAAQWMSAIQGAIAIPDHPIPSGGVDYERGRMCSWVSLLFDSHHPQAGEWMLCESSAHSRTFRLGSNSDQELKNASVLGVLIITLLTFFAMIFHIPLPVTLSASHQRHSPWMMVCLLLCCITTVLSERFATVLPTSLRNFTVAISSILSRSFVQAFSQDLKMIVTVKTSAATIFGALLSTSRRREWDTALLRAEEVRCISPNHRILRLFYTKSVVVEVEQLFYRLPDQCFVVAERFLQQGISFENLFVVKHLQTNSAVVTRVAHMKPKDCFSIFKQWILDGELQGLQSFLESLSESERESFASIASVQRDLPMKSSTAMAALANDLLASTQTGLSRLLQLSHSKHWTIFTNQTALPVFILSSQITEDPILKTSVELNFPMALVLKVILDPNRRCEWDSGVYECERLFGPVSPPESSLSIRKHLDVLRLVLRPAHSRATRRESIQSRLLRRISPTTFVLFDASTPHSFSPSKHLNSTKVLEGGYVLEQVDTDTVRVTFIIQQSGSESVRMSFRRASALSRCLHISELKSHLSRLSELEELDCSSVEALIQDREFEQTQAPQQHRSERVRDLINKGDRGIEVLRSRRAEMDWTLVNEVDGVEIYNARIDGSDKPLVMGVGIVPFSPAVVLSILADINNKPEFDLMFDRGIVLEHWHEHRLKVVRQIFKAVWPTTARDFVNIGYWKYINENEIVVYATSVEHEKAKPSKDYVRAEIIHAGYILSAVGDDKKACKISFLSEVDLKGSLPKSIVNFVSSKQPVQIAKLGALLRRREAKSRLPSDEELKMFEYRTCELQDNQEQVVSLVPVSRQEEWEDDSSSSPLLKVAVPLDPALPQVNAVQNLEYVEDVFARSLRLAISSRNWVPLSNKKGIHVFEGKDKLDKNSKLLKTVSIIDASPADIFAIVADVTRRNWFDSRVVEARELQTIDEHTKIVHVCFDCGIDGVKHDVVLTMQWHIVADGSYVVAACSTDHLSAPEMPRCRRVWVHEAAYHIRAERSTAKSILTYLIHLSAKHAEEPGFQAALEKQQLLNFEALTKLFF